MRRLRRDEYGDIPRHRLARWEQLLMYRICDLLGIGWETSDKTGLAPPAWTVEPELRVRCSDRLDHLEARVAELESETDEGTEEQTDGAAETHLVSGVKSRVEWCC